MIKLKRVYEPAEPEDGYRVLVERLWPRGISKDKAALNLWLKEMAPSPGLRTWFGHDPAKWEEFRKRYRIELENNDNIARLQELTRNGNVTFVYASRDTERNAAVVLKEYLELSRPDI